MEQLYNFGSLQLFPDDGEATDVELDDSFHQKVVAGCEEQLGRFKETLCETFKNMVSRLEVEMTATIDNKLLSVENDLKARIDNAMQAAIDNKLLSVENDLKARIDNAMQAAVRNMAQHTLAGKFVFWPHQIDSMVDGFAAPIFH